MVDSDEIIREEVINIIYKVTRIDKKVISDTVSLRNKLGIDSIEGMHILDLLRKRFNIDIEDIEVFNVDNVTEIIDLVKEYESELEDKDNGNNDNAKDSQI